MKLSAPITVAERPVEEKHLTDWANLEVVPLLKQLRTVVNAQLRERFEAVTNGAGSYKRIWTSAAMPATGAWWLLADVAAVATSGAFQAAGYTLAALYRSSAGTVVQVGGPTTVATAESAALINARFGVDGTARVIYLEGRDDGTSPMRFVALIRQLEALP